ncbi:MAG: hypothetical protein ACYCYI_12925 [Saccharofermentanales bacterium]
MTIKNKLEKLFLIVFGLAFLIYGAMIPVLTVAGAKTVGNITTVRREGGERNESVPNRYSYAVGFEFKTTEGKLISGNTKVIGGPQNAGISKGPATVMYFRKFPYLNALKESSAFPIERIIIFCLGILFMFMVFKRKTRKKAKS